MAHKALWILIVWVLFGVPRMDTPDGHRAITAVRGNYEESIRSSEMTQREWDIWSSRSAESPAQNILVALVSLSAEVRGKLDPLVSGALDTKIMARDQDVKHALRPKKPAAKRPTLDLFPLVYSALTRPDAVFQDKPDVATFHFVSVLIGYGVLYVVVRRCMNITSLRFRTIKVGTWDEMESGGKRVN